MAVHNSHYMYAQFTEEERKKLRERLPEDALVMNCKTCGYKWIMATWKEKTDENN